MPRGSKAKYTEKQKDQAESIERSYERKGVPQSEAEARAWATVNKLSGGGNRSGGSGQEKSKQAKAQSRSSSAKRAAYEKSPLTQHSRTFNHAQARVDPGLEKGLLKSIENKVNHHVERFNERLKEP